MHSIDRLCSCAGYLVFAVGWVPLMDWMVICAAAEAAKCPSREIDDAIWWKLCLKSGLYRETAGIREHDVTCGLFGVEHVDWRILGPYDHAPELSRSIDKIMDTILREADGWEIELYSRPPTAVLTPPSGLMTSHAASTHERGRKAVCIPRRLVVRTTTLQLEFLE